MLARETRLDILNIDEIDIYSVVEKNLQGVSTILCGINPTIEADRSEKLFNLLRYMQINSFYMVYKSSYWKITNLMYDLESSNLWTFKLEAV